MNDYLASAAHREDAIQQLSDRAYSEHIMQAAVTVSDIRAFTIDEWIDHVFNLDDDAMNAIMDRVLPALAGAFAAEDGFRDLADEWEFQQRLDADEARRDDADNRAYDAATGN